ncbi:MAG: response regulator [Anaerolineae bacterium]
MVCPTSNAEQNFSTAVIVEDEKVLSEAYKLVLERVGYEVEVFSNGREALDHFDTHTPNFVLLDLHLPEVSGDAIIDSLKANPDFDNTRIFLATADSRLGRHNETKADAVLIKPIGLQLLQNLAFRYLPQTS